MKGLAIMHPSRFRYPLVLFAVLFGTCSSLADPSVPAGPILGHIDAGQALVWYRPTESGSYELAVSAVRSREEKRVRAASPDKRILVILKR